MSFVETQIMNFSVWMIRKIKTFKKYKSDLLVMRKKIGQMRMDEIKNKTENPLMSLRHSLKYQH